MARERIRKSRHKKELAPVLIASKPGDEGGAARALVEDAPRTPQQDRGQRRVDSILDAAETVLAELGHEAATTNAIAERAGASVGSLYHFFPGKDAILVALARRYAQRMRDINARSMPLEKVGLPLEELFERIVWGQARFAQATPAFAIVHKAVHRKFGSCGAYDELDDSIMNQVRGFLAVRIPGVSAERREAAARLSVSVVHSVVEVSLEMPAAEREALLHELKDMLVRYFATFEEDGRKPD